MILGIPFCTLNKITFLSSYHWWLIYLNVPSIFQTNYDWSLIKITALLRTNFSLFSCNNNVQITVNEPYILNKAVSSGNEAIDYGTQCLLAGQYLVTLEIPSGSAQQAAVFSRRRRRALPDAEIVVDSVSLIYQLYLIVWAGGPDTLSYTPSQVNPFPAWPTSSFLSQDLELDVDLKL